MTSPSRVPEAQGGTMILNAQGGLVWFRPVSPPEFVTDLRVAQYGGQAVLTWWEGTASTGGEGVGVIMDSSYREIARVRAGNGHRLDPHEFVLTARGTALITCNPEVVQADLSSVGGPRDGHAYESVLQEVDVRSGRVLWEWRSLDHVPVAESYMALGGIYDYFHANSIDVLADGNLLVSARHTWALYKLDRRTGAVIWRLGGKKSDFAIEKGARFAWQHHATAVGSEVISVFDNGAAVFQNLTQRQTQRQSRGLLLAIREADKVVQLVHAYRHSPPLSTNGFGSVQVLADGDVVIGWGDSPAFGQYRAGGAALVELGLPLGFASYRVFRAPWQADPAERPAVGVRRHHARRVTTLYASWNGATGVAAWEAWAGPHPTQLRRVAIAGCHGFETALQIPAGQRYAAVRAIGRGARPRASSPVVRL